MVSGVDSLVAVWLTQLSHSLSRKGVSEHGFYLFKGKTIKKWKCFDSGRAAQKQGRVV
jgi:hypothetical protein